MAAINLSSAFNQGLEGGESALSVAMQNYQVQVSEATTKKSEDLVPAEGIGQEFLRAGLGNLGGKIANATGLKSLSKIGQESITTTLRNAAEEAAGKGKAFAAKGVKTRLNDALEARGFSRFSDEELDAIGDKPSDVVKAFAAKAKGTGEQALSAVRDQADAVGGGAQRAVQSAAADAGGVARTAEGDEVFDAFKDHADSRIASLRNRIATDPNVQVVVAADDGAEKTSIGTGLAKGQFADHASGATNSVRAGQAPIENVGDDAQSYVSSELDRLQKDFPGRVKYGRVGGAIPENEIHVWGANSSNVNTPIGSVVTGKEQAAAIGVGSERELGIVSTPLTGLPDTSFRAAAPSAAGAKASEAPLLAVPEDATPTDFKAQAKAAFGGASDADKQSIRNLVRSDPIATRNPLDPDLSSTDRANVLKRRGEIIDDFKQRAAGLDKAPSLPDGGTLGLSAGGSEPARVETKANAPVAPAGEQGTPVPAVPAEPAVAPTEAPAGEAPPPAAAPPPASEPPEPPVSINAADEPPVPNGGAFRQEVESTVKSGMSDVEDGLSTATKTLGAADLAAGGLDVLGDVAEAGLGIASLFLPSLLGGGGSSVAPPTAGFQASCQAGVSSTDA